MAAFVETMRGELTDADGVVHEVAFEVHAVGQGGGRHSLTGAVSLPPWATESAAEGTLVISLRPRAISYAIDFVADDGRHLHLVGRKVPTLLAPIRSMTVMPVAVTAADGSVVAEGTMRFDLRDLLGFIASWLPRRSAALRRLEARQRQIERRAITRGVAS